MLSAGLGTVATVLGVSASVAVCMSLLLLLSGSGDWGERWTFRLVCLGEWSLTLS